MGMYPVGSSSAGLPFRAFVGPQRRADAGFVISEDHESIAQGRMMFVKRR